MDPDAILARIRELIAAIKRGGPDNYDDIEWGLAEAFESLDEWVSRGGFLPSDWNALQRR